MMSKFVGVFRELASFNELLHTQVELILVERLQRNWLKVFTITCCCTGLSCLWASKLESHDIAHVAAMYCTPQHAVCSNLLCTVWTRV